MAELGFEPRSDSQTSPLLAADVNNGKRFLSICHVPGIELSASDTWALFFFNHDSAVQVLFHSRLQIKTGRNFWMRRELWQVGHTPPARGMCFWKEPCGTTWVCSWPFSHRKWHVRAQPSDPLVRTHLPRWQSSPPAPPQGHTHSWSFSSPFWTTCFWRCDTPEAEIESGPCALKWHIFFKKIEVVSRVKQKWFFFFLLFSRFQNVNKQNVLK